MGRLDDLINQIVPEQVPGVVLPPGHAPFVGRDYSDQEGTQSFSVVSGTPLDERVSFVVGSAIVDNNASAWLNLPDATRDGTGRWVPPGQGAAIPILGHISRARVVWTAPPGKVQPAFVAGEAAQVVFTAAPVPPGFGISAGPSYTARGIAFADAVYAVGTYVFDPPAPLQFRGMVIYVSTAAGAGNVVASIQDRDASVAGSGRGVAANVISSAAIAANSSTRIWSYPGGQVVANAATNDVLGLTPRIQIVVATGSLQLAVDYDFLP